MDSAEMLALLGKGFGSFSGILSEWSRRQPEAPALRDETRTLTWGELEDCTGRIAARLRETGLQRGQAVAILGTSGIAYALVYLAAIRAGGVAAPLTTSASPEQLAAMVADSGARHLFIDRAKLAELGEGFAQGLDRIVFDEQLGAWMEGAARSDPPCEPAPEEPFNIIYSSGTTGTPKGIVHSHAMRWYQFAPTALSYLQAGHAVRSLTSTPLYSNTTMVAFLSALLAGGTVTIMGRFMTLGWLELAQRDRITTTMLVPVQYRRLMDEARFDEFDLSQMRIKYCTSAPFPPDLKAEVLRRMPGGLIEIYGMTEGGVTCLLYAHEYPDKLHTVGRPAPGHELKVIGEDGRELPAGEAGELVGRSGAMMTGYRNREKATREALWTDAADGSQWMRMGDIGRLDADGFLELVGRTKDMIISGGFNIYPSDLEAVLAEDARVAEAAVVGVPSERWGETPVGFVRLARGTDAAELEAICEAANARLGKTQRLSALYAIDEMPRSHIGKLLKTELREMALGRSEVA